MDADREPNIHIFLCVCWWGRMCRRVSLLYRVCRKFVCIAMGNDNVDFRTLHFQSDFKEIPTGPPGCPQDVPGRYFQSQCRPQGRPWSPQGRFQSLPGLSGDPFEMTVRSPGLPQEHPRTLFECRRLPWSSLEHFFHLTTLTTLKTWKTLKTFRKL